MKKSWGRVVLLLTLSVSIALSFLTGELIGMKSGYAYSQKVTAPMEAAYLVSVIGLIDSGMSEKAREMLDTKLDNYIIDHWSASRCELTGLNPFVDDIDNSGLFSSTIYHRDSNPSENSIVRAHLETLRKGAGSD